MFTQSKLITQETEYPSYLEEPNCGLDGDQVMRVRVWQTVLHRREV